MKIVIFLLIAILSGCANTDRAAWYGQSFIGYRISDGDDFASCSKENAGIRLGREYRVSDNFKVAAEYEHVSHLLCGRPFNKDPDAELDHIGITVTYGGLR